MKQPCPMRSRVSRWPSPSPLFALVPILCIVIQMIPSSKLHAKELISIGSKKFTENVILGELARLLLIDAGIKAQHRRELGGTRILWEALQRGDLNVYPEYTGTLRYELLQDPGLQSWRDLKEVLQAKGLGLTRPFGFNNTYGFGMRRDQAKRLGIEKISDLKQHPDLRFGLGHEFMDRADGWPGLRQQYGLRNQDIRGMDHDIGYKAIESGTIDIIDVYTTDAEIAYYDLLVLDDDKDYFPAYEAVYLYRLDLAPVVIEKLKRLSGHIDAMAMIEMNKAGKIDKTPAAIVAQTFLRDELGIDVPIETHSLAATILQRTKEHLILVSISMAAAILLSVSLGFLAAQLTSISRWILAGVGIIQTIPSLALLVIMIPIFGIGSIPALVALFLYSLLPIVRGTYYGFEAISRELREAAQAIGLSRSARFWKVYWPLALPSILNGIKTSVVINIGTATLGALIGAGGYGQTILKGIRLDNPELIMAGAIPAAVLAIAAQLSFDALETLVVSKGLRL